MKTTIISLAAAAVMTLGVASTASAAPASLAAPAAKTTVGSQIKGGAIEISSRRRFYIKHLGLWKYDYQPRYICKHHYRWVWTRVGWRQVYVGFRCGYTNNY